MHSTKVL